MGKFTNKFFQSSQTEGSFGEDGNSSRGEQLKPNFNL